MVLFFLLLSLSPFLENQLRVPTGSPPRGGDVTVHVYDIDQPSLPLLFILFLCLFLSMALSTVFYSMKFPDNSPFFHSVLPVL